MTYSWSTLGFAVRGHEPKAIAEALWRMLPEGTTIREGAVTLAEIETSRATIISDAVNGWCAVMMRREESPLLAVELSGEVEGEVWGFECHDDCPELVLARDGDMLRRRLEGDEYANEGEPHALEPEALSFDDVVAFIERVTRPFAVEVGDRVVFVESP